MDQRFERLREWGCDVDAAMKRMLDDEEFYLECLNSVVNDGYFSELGNALKAKDITAAFDSAHTLKGILANVGVTPMYTKVTEIVEPLRAGVIENLTDKYCELEEMRSHLAEILE